MTQGWNIRTEGRLTAVTLLLVLLATTGVAVSQVGSCPIQILTVSSDAKLLAPGTVQVSGTVQSPQGCGVDIHITVSQSRNGNKLIVRQSGDTSLTTDGSVQTWSITVNDPLNWKKGPAFVLAEASTSTDRKTLSAKVGIH